GAKNETELGSGYLQAFCNTRAGGSSEIHCKAKFDEVAAFVDTADWEDRTATNGARNSDNSGRLTILDSVGSGDTSDYNYVKAGKDGLKIDDDVKNNSARSDNTLMLLEAGVTDALGSGVAFTRIDYNNGFSHQGGDIKYYAGILSGTDLGGPLKMPTTAVDSNGEVSWNTVLSIVIGDRVVLDKTGVLFINFANKTFQTRMPRISLDLDGNVFIAGGFTDASTTGTAGIVYGTVKIGSTKNSAHSDGTLTGLIGSKGLVAAFVSDGVGNTKEFAGGFVADNRDIAPDCSIEGDAFDPLTCPLSVRLPLCRDRDEVSVTTADCKTAEIRGVVCATTGNYASLVDKICDGGDYEAAREQAFCTAASGAQANPFHSVCLDPMVADMYDVFRQTACAGQPVDVPSGGRTGLDARCNDPITKLCEADPFNPMAGAGTVTFNCLAATDSNYVEAREAEIAFCADETKSTDSRCMQSTVSMITTDCRRDPLDS
ncbi:MAG: hypothetical protein K8953_09020, partial [Proteobacteria bacterium]|nr:hypothetical protein [Pseudomonadota bacterium]